MLNLITKKDLNKERSYRDIDKDNGNTLKILIENKEFTTKKCAKYFNCSTDTIRKRIRKYNIDFNFSDKKTNHQFLKEVKEQVGIEYKPLEKYKGTNTKILMRHEECGHEYKVTPNCFLNAGRRCPKCNGGVKKTTEGFKEIVYDLVKDLYIVLGEYYGTHNKILMRHNSENCDYYEWEISPTNFLAGHRCPKCSGHKHKTTKEFKKDVYDLVKNRYTVLGKYINTKTKILMRHEECGHEYKVRPQNFLQGRRCPLCNNSKGENKIRNWLKENNFNFIHHYWDSKCKNKNGNKLEFDFKININNSKILIEYNGLQHYKPVDFFGGFEGFEKQKENDKIKNQFCKENNIELLVIPYWNKDKIKDILKEKLL